MEVNQEAHTGRDHCESGRALVLEGEPPQLAIPGRRGRKAAWLLVRYIAACNRHVLGRDDDLDRVADALTHDVKGLGDGCQRELVGHQVGPAQSTLGGQ
jgi:hypothetical protein